MEESKSLVSEGELLNFSYPQHAGSPAITVLRRTDGPGAPNKPDSVDRGLI